MGNQVKNTKPKVKNSTNLLNPNNIELIRPAHPPTLNPHPLTSFSSFILPTSSLLLILLGLWLGWRLLDGTLSYYLHPRFNLLIAATAALLILLGGKNLLLGRPKKPDPHAMLNPAALVLLGLVVGLGLLVTPQPLETNRLTGGANSGSANRALSDALLKQNWQNNPNLDTSHWNLLDWSAALNDNERAAKLTGRPVEVTGFVVRPEGVGSRYFLLARYVVVCCTADSTALKLPVIAAGIAGLEEGQWVRVRGTLGQATNGVFGFLADSVENIARPAQPYIYP